MLLDYNGEQVFPVISVELSVTFIYRCKLLHISSHICILEDSESSSQPLISSLYNTPLTFSI